MANATPTTVSIAFDPNATSLQSDVIMGASSNKAGVMTAAQFQQLASLSDLTPAVVAQLLALIAELPPATVTALLDLLASLPPATVTALLDMLTLFTANAGPKIFTNALRPPANDPQFTDAIANGYVAVIWNSDDKAPNYSNGTDWYDAAGNLT